MEWSIIDCQEKNLMSNARFCFSDGVCLKLIAKIIRIETHLESPKMDILILSSMQY